MPHKTVLGWGLALTALCLTAAFAQQQPLTVSGTMVAVVDMTLVFERADMVKDLERIFEQRRRQLQAESDSNKENIRKLQAELDSGAFAKDSDDYQDRLAALEMEKLKREQWLRKQERSLSQEHKKYFEDVYRRVTRACESVARSQGFDVVLSDNPIDFNVPESGALVGQILQKKIIYASARIDLTAVVLDAMNDEYRAAGGAEALIKLAK